MSDETAFLLAICDHPEEDTPRLVFADWLDERGGPVNTAWAELIRVQVALDRDPGSDDGRLRTRERALDWVTGPAWTERLRLPGWGRWSIWARGFPTVLRSPDPNTAAWFAAAPPVPVEEVEIRGWDDDAFRTFLNWPGLRAARGLALWGVPAPFTAGALALARCEHLGKLERLHTMQVAVTDEVALAILDSPHLKGLRELSTDSGQIVSGPVRERLRERFRGWHD